MLQYLALAYGAVAWLAAILGALVGSDAARHFVMGLLIGPWAETLDLATETGTRWLALLLALSLTAAAALFLGMHVLKKTSNRHAYGVTGLVLALVGGLVVGLEIQNVVMNDTFSGFIVFAAALLVGGIWLAGEHPSQDSN